jgi:hypothetical protein
MEAGFLPISVDSRKAAFDLRGSGVHLKFEHTRSVVGAPIVRTPLGGGRHSPNYTAPVGRRLARTAVRDQQDEARRDGRMHEGGNEGGTKGRASGCPRIKCDKPLAFRAPIRHDSRSSRSRRAVCGSTHRWGEASPFGEPASRTTREVTPCESTSESTQNLATQDRLCRIPNQPRSASANPPPVTPATSGVSVA